MGIIIISIYNEDNDNKIINSNNNNIRIATTFNKDHEVNNNEDNYKNKKGNNV